MIKPALQIIDDDNGFIVEISKSIYGLDQYDRTREIKKFHTTEVKQLEYAVEYCIVQLLEKYSIYTYDDTEDAIKSAIDTLYRIHGKHIVIEDLYTDTNECVVHRKKKQTCILDNKSVLSIANKVYVE